MSGPDLKPCPFCGGRARVYEVFGRLAAGCQNKACNIKPDTWLTAGVVYDVRKIIRFWNQRAEGCK